MLKRIGPFNAPAAAIPGYVRRRRAEHRKQIIGRFAFCAAIIVVLILAAGVK